MLNGEIDVIDHFVGQTEDVKDVKGKVIHFASQFFPSIPS